MRRLAKTGTVAFLLVLVLTQAAAAQTLQAVVGIPLDPQPIPVEVPKRSISRELAERIDSARR